MTQRRSRGQPCPLINLNPLAMEPRFQMVMFVQRSEGITGTAVCPHGLVFSEGSVNRISVFDAVYLQLFYIYYILKDVSAL